MPTIPIYEAPAREIAIPDRGVTAIAQAGRRLGQLGNERAADIAKGAEDVARGAEQFGNDLENAGKLQTANEGSAEILRLGAQSAILKNALGQQLQQTIAGSDPTDPNVQQKFLDEKVLPAYDQLEQNATTPEGKRWVAEHSAQELPGWAHNIQAGQATQVNINAVSDYDTAVKHLTASTAQDPLTLGDNLRTLRGLTDAYINATAGTMTAADAAKLSAERYNASAADMVREGYAAKLNPAQGGNPNTDMTAFKKQYGDVLGGKGIEELDAVQHHFQDQARKTADDDRVAQERQAKDLSTQNSQTAIGQLISPQTGQYIGPTAGSNWRLNVVTAIGKGLITHQDGSALLGLQDRLSKPQQEPNDPATFQHFMQLAGRAPDDPQRPTLDQVYDTIGRGLDLAHGRMVIDAIQRKSPQDIADTQQFNADAGALAAAAGQLSTNMAANAYAAVEARRLFTDGFSKARAGGYTSEYLSPDGQRSYTKTVDLAKIAKAAADSSVHPVAVPTAPVRVQPNDTGSGVVPIPPAVAPPVSSFFGSPSSTATPERLQNTQKNIQRGEGGEPPPNLPGVTFKAGETAKQYMDREDNKEEREQNEQEEKQFERGGR